MVFAKKIQVMSNNGIPTFHNVTAQVKEAIRESGIKTGKVTVLARLYADIAITNPASFVKRVASAS